MPNLTDMRQLSSWEKFSLLFWKNCKVQFAHKIHICIIIGLPVICCAMLTWIRISDGPKKMPETHYMPFNVTDFRIVRLGMRPLRLAYTPKNPFIDSIVLGVVTQTGMRGADAFPDAYGIERALIRNEYFAGIIFEDSSAHLRNYPRQLKFTLRLPGHMIYSTHRLFDYFRTTEAINPKNFTLNSPYVNEGFIQLQNAITMSYLRLASGVPIMPNILLQRRPEAPHISDKLISAVEQLTYKILFLSYLFPLIIITKYIGSEKEYQLKEMIKVMGVESWIHWVAWFCHAFILLLTSAVIITIMLFVEWDEQTAVFNFSDSSVFLLVLIVYFINCICFCFMISVMLAKASQAGAAIGFSAYFTFFPFFFLRESEIDKTASVTLPWCFAMNTGFGVAMKTMFSYEAVEEGIHWHNIFVPPPGCEVALSQVLLMMSSGCILFMLICLYVEQINPGDYGVPKKWNFPFKASFWSNVPAESKVGDSSAKTPRSSKFEAEPIDERAGLFIKNITKIFDKTVAVNSVSFNLYYGEITVLLGHNGAGKTTLISMLTGMMSPTSGTAIVNGFDIRTEFERCRLTMGICPQHNVIFEEMTVRDHLKFYCILKGLTGESLENEIKKYLKIIALEDKAKVQAKNLSGGQKRKLCVCCALCGDSKVVLLDEPSSGMDPDARRHLWKILQDVKKSRVILLTTHFMDEADLLGDRVAIMCGGELKCYGSPFFLKKRYGSGYRLTLIKQDLCQADKVTDFLQQFIPEIQPQSDIGAELNYTLPTSYTPHFQKLLKSLEDNTGSLQLNGYGISAATIEDVFMKVGEETHEQMPKIRRSEDPMFSNQIQRVKGFKLLAYHWEAMLLKRALCNLRKYHQIITQIVIPSVFLMFTIAISDSQPNLRNLPAMTFGLKQYAETVTILESNKLAPINSPEYMIPDEYHSYVKSQGVNHRIASTGEKTFADYFLSLRLLKKDLAFEYVGGATIVNSDQMTVWFNSHLVHELPLSLNLLHNAIAKVVLDDDAEIVVTNHPLPFSSGIVLKMVQKYGQTLGLEIAFMLGFVMPFTTTFFIGFIVREHRMRSKLLQFQSGVGVFTYWLANIICDMLIYLIVLIVFMCVLAVHKKEGLREFDEIMRYFWLLLLFGLASILLTYVLSFVFSEGATGYVICTSIYLLWGLVWHAFTLFLFRIDGKEDIAKAFRSIGRIFPHYALMEGFSNLYHNEMIRRACQAEEFEHLSSDKVCNIVEECCDIEERYSLNYPGILPDIISLSVTAIASFVLLILIDYNVFQRLLLILTHLCSRKQSVFESHQGDDDVEAEREFIKNMSIYQIEKENLVVDRVAKHYGKFVAVKGISFIARRKECFGLIGVNGAGKTTTFKMLTGDIIIPYGAAYIKGILLNRHMNKAYKEIGYCPQFDALNDDLTGNELIKIYCLLRGIPKQKIPAITEYLAYSFGFEKHLNKRAKKYSGGNKRKLSTAIAMVGGPSVIFLDEPTTGMDPASRRHIWNMVCYVRDVGKTVILTTHSMEECEALCTRVVIMVNGEFKCLGSIQHLKNKFSKGIILKIKIKMERKSNMQRFLEDTRDSGGNQRPELTGYAGSNLLETKTDDNHIFINQFNLEAAKTFVEGNFPNAKLNEEHQGILTYYIPADNVIWSNIFGLLERNRNVLNYEDYSISQTSFEQIFLSFAIEQMADLPANSRRSKRWSSSLYEA